MRTIRTLAALGAAIALVAPAPAASSHNEGTPAPLRAEGRWLVDQQDRAVLLHGVNVVYKRPPYHPSRREFNAADARLMRRLGFNVVRLGIIWKGLEPQRGRYDERYLGEIERLVRLLARHRIHTLLDFHQDIWNEKYGGEGAPDWAVIDDGLWTGAEPALLEGWQTRYFTPGVSQAFESFWTNRQGIQDAYIDAWVHVARRFRRDPWVVGYDLMNEPFPGYEWAAFQTPVFEATQLQPFYERAIAAIRAVDPDHVIWWEPSVTNVFGAANGVGLVEPLEGENLGMSFHAYCLAGDGAFGFGDSQSRECAFLDRRTWTEQSRARNRNGDTWLLTEFGSTENEAEIDEQADHGDEHLLGWTYWAWKHYDDPTGSPFEGLVRANTGPLRLKPKVRVLSRPYPTAVAGRPTRIRFDVETRRFDFSYRSEGADGSETEIFVPVALHYPNGYRLHVSGAEVVSAPGASRLRLANDARYPGVSVVITPR